ncbi:MAG: hypothetical protein FWE03_01385 [Firmicutes bacterium]|nr:hypothetical protein [Bacillota bacterium]
MEYMTKELKDTIVQLLKTQHYAILVSASINGFNFSASDIAIKKGDDIEVFRITVVKHKKSCLKYFT